MIISVASRKGGTDLALAVTEPIPSGIHDMERIIQMAHNFKTQTACCKNKYDINIQNSANIESWCEKNSTLLQAKLLLMMKLQNPWFREFP